MELPEGADIKPPWEFLFLWKLSILSNSMFSRKEALKVLE